MSMNGIDISSWQEGISIENVDADFVVVKITQGLDYVNEYWKDWAERVLACGKKLGLYHYAEGLDPQAEAEYFLQYARPYKGRAVLALDWEEGDNQSFNAHASWCNQWLKRVETEMSSSPFLYCQQSIMHNFEWPLLWVAQYPDYNRSGYQEHPWNEGAYSCVMRQYCPVGNIRGYDGDLDLDLAYFNKEDWDRYATSVYVPNEPISSSVSMNEAAAALMIHLCEHDWHGYSQIHRWGDGEGYCPVIFNGVTYYIPQGDYDCSSSIVSVYKAAGLDVDAHNTYDMKQAFLNTGKFEWRDMSFTAQVGDIYLYEGDINEGTGHTAMCTSVIPDMLAEFSQSETYGIDGVTGDQTGWESSVHAFYKGNWNGILHYIGGVSNQVAPIQNGSNVGNEDLKGVVYEVHTSDGWLGPVYKVDNTEAGYAGYLNKGIDGIRAYRTDGRELKIQAIMDNGREWSWTTFNGSLFGSNSEGDGYSGWINSGHYIIGLRIFGAHIRVKAGDDWLGWSFGNSKTDEGDDFAGEDLIKKIPISAVQMYV